MDIFKIIAISCVASIVAYIIGYVRGVADTYKYGSGSRRKR